jgi:hypothetical protein
MCCRHFKLNWVLLLFIFLVGGCSSSSSGTNVVSATISGTITFADVPADKTLGLLYASTIERPVRGVVVEALNATTYAVLATTTTDAAGRYSVTVQNYNVVIIRVKAQMMQTGLLSWDFQVVDNTRDKALYAMDSAPFDISGLASVTKDLLASSGWGGNSYSNTRVAAPFAILNTVYKAVQKVKSVSPFIAMPQLLINWSINNRPASGDVALGEISTSHYTSSEKQLYILGKENVDTDEYDDHVVAHEWGHYFEDRFSRSDSMGNSHGSGDKLDPRVAFGEGFGNAISGMVTDDIHYIDTWKNMQGSVETYMDLSSGTGDTVSVGWFSEDSVQYILYRLYTQMGFQPIYDVLVGGQKTTDSYTTIFSFISHLKAVNPGYVGQINTALTAKNITTFAVDVWDSTATETNNGGDAGTLPVYTLLTKGDAAKRVCVDNQFGNINKLMTRKFFYFQAPTPGTYTIKAAVFTAGGIPNIRLIAKGVEVGATDNRVTGNATLAEDLKTGHYVGEVYDYRYLTKSSAATENVCFDITLN